MLGRTLRKEELHRGLGSRTTPLSTLFLRVALFIVFFRFGAGCETQPFFFFDVASRLRIVFARGQLG
jgi:hypothetical protein